ncbi:MAG: hypothetical protein V2J26_05120 [Pacificimonas sp.]|jgi:hypothetical protein|nr:hypothetical protein [Pacificimonas sp.]
MIRTRTLLLLSAASMAAAVTANPASAARYVFGGEGAIEDGRSYRATSGTTQLMLDNGALVSLVDAANFTVNGLEVRLDRGGVTIAGPGDSTVTLITPSGTAMVSGAAALQVSNAGFNGNVLSGSMRVSANGETRRYSRGDSWRVNRGSAPRQVMANRAQATPQVSSLSDGGVAAAAENGLPVTLGLALEAIGAEGDIVEAAIAVDAASANPGITALPSGTITRLLAFSDDLAGALGGATFTGVTPDLVNAYLQFLAGGGQIAEFQSSFTALVNQYLAALAAGGNVTEIPSAGGALPNLSTDALNAYLEFLQANGALTAIAESQQDLLSAYLAFISDGGTPANFVVPGAALNPDVLDAYVTAIQNYVALLSAGGSPDSFAVPPETILGFLESLEASGLIDDLLASQASAIQDYLAFVRAGNDPGDFDGFVDLDGDLPQALAEQYAGFVQAYVSFLRGGGDPAAFAGGAGIIATYIQALENAGLVSDLIPDFDEEVSAYLDFIQSGGNPADFTGFGISQDLATQYASALQTFIAFVQSGGDPADFTGVGELTEFIDALQDNGLLADLLGTQAEALTNYLAFIQGGGSPSDFVGFGLSDDLVAQYVATIQSYVAFIQGGGDPADFAGGADQIETLLNTLEANGLLAALGAQSDTLEDYLQFVVNGGNPGDFTGFGLSQALIDQYQQAIIAYVDFLRDGGDPADFTGGAAQIEAFLNALEANGLLEDVFAGQAIALQEYLSFLQGGGDPGDFNGFGLSPALVDQYVATIQAYVAFLQGGGDPADFAGGAAQIEAFLEALQDNDLLEDALGAQAAALQAYLAFVNGGGDPGNFDGFGISDAIAQQYAAALNAFLAFIQDGGVPSQFTGLSEQVFQAYLEALQAAGLLATLLPDQADFFADYLAFLQMGGSFDEFGGLPAPFEFPVPQGRIESNQFVAVKGDNASVGTGGFSGLSERDNAQVTYDPATGAPLYYVDGSRRFAIGDATLIEGGSTAGGIGWGRWVNGSSFAFEDTEYTLGTVGIHLIAGPLATDIPAEGLIEYNFAGGTNPTLSSGEVGTLSSALAAVSFGADARVGFDLTASFTDNTYTIQTLGGIQETAANGIPIRSDLAPGRFFSGGGGETIITGNTCASGCTVDVRGWLSGPGAEGLALHYTAYEVDGDELLGTAAFTKGNPLDTSGGGGILPDGPGGDRNATPSGTVDDYTVSYVSRSAREVVPATEVAFNDDGTIGRFSRATSGTNVQQLPQSNSLTDPDDAGFIGDIIQWARWGNTANQNTSGGLHAVTGITTLALPTQGTVSYALVGGTEPTGQGSLTTEETGAFSGSLSVAFGTAPTVTLDASVFLLDRGYGFEATGNVDTDNFSFFGTDSRLTGLTDTSCTSANSCGGTFEGSFYGEDGSFAGLVYALGDGIGNSTGRVFGSAVFEAGAAGIAMVGAMPTTGGGSQQDPSVTPTGTLTNYFVATAGRNARDTTFTSAPTVTFSDAGAIERYQRQTSSGPRTVERRQSLNDFGFVGNIVQWTASGSPDNPFHILSGIPTTSLPMSGSVSYGLVGGTLPVGTGRLAGTETGAFAGTLSVTFGTTASVDVDAQVYLGEFAFGLTDSFALDSFTFTSGSSAGANVTGLNDSTCIGVGCFGLVYGSLFGDDAGYAGFSYEVGSGSGPNRGGVVGTAAFQANAPGIASIGTIPSTGGGSSGGQTGMVANEVMVYTGLQTGIDNRQPVTVTYENGAPVSYVWELNDFTRSNEAREIGTNQALETGSVAEIIGWTRWAGGTTAGTYFQRSEVDLPANGGEHIVSGTPATNLPGSGTVGYELVGATSPTVRDGSAAPGTFSGDLAVGFGSEVRVGFEFDIAIDGSTYALNTPGGVADVSGGALVDTSGGDFNMIWGVPTLPVVGDGSLCSGCNANVQGFLAGDGASHVGVAYTFGSAANQDGFVSGSAVFGVRN